MEILIVKKNRKLAKRFNGKLYHPTARWTSKKLANTHAEGLRGKGKLVRVVQQDTVSGLRKEYVVYER